MDARGFVFFVLVSHMWIAVCVTGNKIKIPGVLSNSKKELTPLFISTSLNDIIVISAPIIDNITLYYLTKPNGEEGVLNLNISHLDDFKLKAINDNILTYIREPEAVTKPINNYILNNERSCHNYNEVEMNFPKNEFTVGPLDEDDHGNWVLSAYYENGGEWVELFQIITIEIIEKIPSLPAKPSLHPGEDFHLRFAYQLQDLESCEIVSPRSAFDRFYDRYDVQQDCAFRVPNVTRDDEGLWKIIGVGKIVYEANVYLEIETS